MEKQQREQVDKNIREAKEKLEAELESAKHEHQLMLMRQGRACSFKCPPLGCCFNTSLYVCRAPQLSEAVCLCLSLPTQHSAKYSHYKFECQ